MGSTPMTLRCPKCKVGEDWRTYNRPSSNGLKRTAAAPREKKRDRKWRRVQQVQVVHEPCGHVFWTTHPSWTTNPHRSGAPGA